MLIDMFVNSGEIDINFPQEIRPSHITPYFDRANPLWEIDINGLASISCVYHVNALSCDELQRVMIKNQHNNQLQSVPADRDVSHSVMSPILRIELSVSLHVNEGRVTPVLSALKIDSYSRDVTPTKLTLDDPSILRK